MRRHQAVLGALFAAFTGIVWGGQFVVGKSALAHVDAFWLTTVRYAAASAVLLLLLGAVEGRAALSPRGRVLPLLVLGTLGFAGFNLLATLVGTAAGWLSAPSGGALWSVTPQLLYLALPGAVVAVLTWNAAVELIGPQTTSLFGNLIPVSTFTIEIARGYRPGALELAGAAIAIGALVAYNLLSRPRTAQRRSAHPAEAREVRAEAA